MVLASHYQTMVQFNWHLASQALSLGPGSHVNLERRCPTTSQEHDGVPAPSPDEPCSDLHEGKTLRTARALPSGSDVDISLRCCQALNLGRYFPNHQVSTRNPPPWLSAKLHLPAARFSMQDNRCINRGSRCEIDETSATQVATRGVR